MTCPVFPPADTCLSVMAALTVCSHDVCTARGASCTSLLSVTVPQAFFWSPGEVGWDIFELQGFPFSIDLTLVLALHPKHEDSILLPVMPAFSEHLLLTMSFTKLIAGRLTHITLSCRTPVTTSLQMKELRIGEIKHPAHSLQGSLESAFLCDCRAYTLTITY